MVKGGDLFGDGINIAARLQTVASPGGVCLQGIAAELNRRRIPTASGQGRWQAVQVRRVLARL
jgi:class 3 adenylate cyclase